MFVRHFMVSKQEPLSQGAKKNVLTTLEERNMLWTPEKITPVEPAEGKQAPNGFFLYRGPHYLSHVGEKYSVLSNRALFTHCQDILDRYRGAVIEDAGELNHGSVVYMVLKLGEAEIREDDTVGQYLLCISSHDGSISTQVIPADSRFACTNMLQALRSAARGWYSLKHTKSQEENLPRLFNAVDKAIGEFRINTEKYRTLAEQEIGVDTAEQYFRGALRMPEDKADDSTRAKKKLEVIMDAFKAEGDTGDLRGQGNETAGGQKTLWDAFNALTEHMTHHQGRSSANNVLAMTTQRDRNSQLTGALQLAVDTRAEIAGLATQ